MERRKENPELKPYIENFLIDTLENCELFVKTYGKGFVKERLQKNFKKVYTDELNSRAAGQYSLGTSGEITLFSKGFDGNLLTFKDIEEDSSLKATTLHEGVHAVFNKTPEECEKLGIAYGSGIHCIYHGANNELGRGVNEGYTNWVCEKAGLDPKSYTKFTNMVRLFEMAIGPEKVMQFGQGDIEKNIAPLLDMPLEECAELFSKADSIYDYDDKSRDYMEAKLLLSSKIKLKNGIEGKVPQYILEDIQKLNSNDLYRRVLRDPEYKRFAQENNLELESDENIKEYFSKKDDFYSEKSKVLLHDIHATIISKYFMKELDTVLEEGSCSIEQYQKFGRMANLVLVYGERKNDVMKSFDEKIETLRTRFLDKTIDDIKKSILDGTISAEQLESYQSVFNADLENAINFEDEVSKLMLPEDSYTYQKLFHTLSYENKLSNLFDYKILKLNTEKGKQENLFFDTKQENHFSRYSNSSKTLDASDEITETDGIIDITLSDLQSMQEIVNNFLKLKEEIKQKSPNAKIQIVESIIISTDDTNTPSFYMIEGNEIVSAQPIEMIPQNRKAKEEISFDTPEEIARKQALELESKEKSQEPEELLEASKLVAQQENDNTSTSLKPISKNPFKRFFENMRSKILKMKESFIPSEKQDIEEKNNEENRTNVSSSKEFDERIRVDIAGKYDPTQQQQGMHLKQKSKDDDLTK